MMSFSRIRAVPFFLSVCAVAALLMVSQSASVENELPGGLTGTVYARADSLDPPWAPRSGVLVLVAPSPDDSVQTAEEITITVRDTRVEPERHVTSPGASLRIVSRSSRIQTIVAETETGKKLFSIALPMPGLEVVKRLEEEGLIRVFPRSRGQEAGVTILVLPNSGSAVTDSVGAFLIPGIPPRCRELWAFDPDLGSVSDSVCIEPARATEIDLYLPHIPLPSNEFKEEADHNGDHNIVE